MTLSFPHFQQLDHNDCGPTCLRIIARFHRKKLSINTIKNTTISREGVNLKSLKQQAERLGFDAKYDLITFHELTRKIKDPVVIFWNQNHFVVLYKITRSKVYLSDPASGLITLQHHEFLKGWSQHSENKEAEGIVLFLHPTPSLYHSDENTKSHKLDLKFGYKYLKTYKYQLIQVSYSLLLGSIIQLIIPFMTQIIVDYGIVGHNQNIIYIIAASQLALLISSTSLEFLRSWSLIYVSTRINVSIISDFLKKLMNLPISFFDSKITGDLIQRIRDHKRVEEFITEHLLKSIFALFSIIIFLSILYIYSRVTFMIIFIGSFIEIGCVFVFINRRKVFEEHNFSLLSRDSEKLFELMTSMQEIKLNNIETMKRLDWQDLQEEIFNMNLKKLKITHLEQGFSRFFNYLQQTLVIFYSALLVYNNQITLGTMVTIIFILGQLNLPITQLINLVISANYAKISLTRLLEVHNLPSELVNENHNWPVDITMSKDIQLKNVCFSYTGREIDNVLKNISLIIPEGKTTAIVGTSGSGKTTLLKLLLRIYENFSGKITIENKSIKDYEVSSWRRLWGAVLQDSYIFSDTIENNIILGEEYDELRLERAAKLANIYDYIHSLPLSFKTRLGRTGNGLSQGQKQRILIARIFYKNPAYLCLDEATNSLDTQNESEIVRNLELEFKDKTIIVVAHRLNTVKNADQIIVLDQGRIVEHGSHNQLIKLKGKYFNLIKNQLELGA